MNSEIMVVVLLGDSVGEDVLIGVAVVGLELGDIVGPEVDRSPLASKQRLIASAIVGCRSRSLPRRHQSQPP